MLKFAASKIVESGGKLGGDGDCSELSAFADVFTTKLATLLENPEHWSSHMEGFKMFCCASEPRLLFSTCCLLYLERLIRDADTSAALKRISQELFRHGAK